MPMPVEIEATAIPAVKRIKTGLFGDQRGFFSESYSKMVWEEAGFRQSFVQDNLSKSGKGVLRGMHYQIHPHAMGKLIRCITGAIFDVAVDLRKGSPTFGQWVGQELSGENNLALWVPEGFAHGFVSLAEDSLVYYKCTEHHAPETERALHYACPKIGIEWPIAPAIISPKDEAAPSLQEAEYNFTFQAG